MTRVSDNWTACVLDLFSAAAGGWSLGLHRAGFRTMAACEVIEWRSVLYSENNPSVKVYDDVRTLTASRLLDDFGYLPSVVVGSPPCQDISSANTKGKGVEGERSGLYFEAIRIIGECRPRWFALENSANLRTRGADRVIAALADIGYTCWPFVVGADDVGANHKRKRSWLIGCDVEQLTDADSDTLRQPVLSRRSIAEAAIAGNIARHPAQDGCGSGLPGRRAGPDTGAEQPTCWDALDTASFGHEGGLARGYRPHGDGAASVAAGNAADPDCQLQYGGPEQSRPESQGRCVSSDGAADRNIGWQDGAGAVSRRHGGLGASADAHGHPLRFAELSRGPGTEAPIIGDADKARNTPDPDQARQARQAHGCMVPGLRQAEIADDGRSAGRGADGSGDGQVAICPPDRRGAVGTRAGWSLDDLAAGLQLDDGIPAWVADTRIAVGGPKGTSAASLIVEAFGDAVLPQIPEAIGRAILRTEAALSAVYDRSMAA